MNAQQHYFNFKPKSNYTSINPFTIPRQHAHSPNQPQRHYTYTQEQNKTKNSKKIRKTKLEKKRESIEVILSYLIYGGCV